MTTTLDALTLTDIFETVVEDDPAMSNEAATAAAMERLAQYSPERVLELVAPVIQIQLVVWRRTRVHQIEIEAHRSSPAVGEGPRVARDPQRPRPTSTPDSNDEAAPGPAGGEGPKGRRDPQHPRPTSPPDPEPEEFADLPPVDVTAERREWLSQRVYVAGYGYVPWGEMTAEHHRARVAYLERYLQGIGDTIRRHQQAIVEIEAAGVECLNDIYGVAS